MAEVADAQRAAVVDRPQPSPEQQARKRLALRLIRKLGDPALRSVALPVTVFDRYLRNEAKRMGQIMEDAEGIGLAATQLGVMHRLLVYRVEPEAELTALANPRIVWQSEHLEAGEEGCLSIPGVHVTVQRPVAVRVVAQDLRGRERTVEAEGLEARVIQHELDHLEGVLIIDRITTEQRREAMRALREARMAAAEAD